MSFKLIAREWTLKYHKKYRNIIMYFDSYDCTYGDDWLALYVQIVKLIHTIMNYRNLRSSF